MHEARLALAPLGTGKPGGAAGSGESEIRRYLLEHDLVEAIVALPHVPDAWMDRAKDRIGLGYDRSSGFRRRFITAVTTIRSASSQ